MIFMFYVRNFIFNNVFNIIIDYWVSNRSNWSSKDCNVSNNYCKSEYFCYSGMWNNIFEVYCWYINNCEIECCR